jgi:hypothetical protein
MKGGGGKRLYAVADLDPLDQSTAKIQIRKRSFEET